MKFKQNLVRGKLIKRYKRFLADVEIDGPKPGRLEGGLTSEASEACAAPEGGSPEHNNKFIVTAHCANSGRMTGLDEPGFTVWLAPKNGDTKLKYSFEIVDTGTALVGVNTMHPNYIVSEAIKENLIPELAGYSKLSREVKYGKNSRIDILLESDGKPACFVEVKNVHLSRRTGIGEFPDAVTERGAEHMHELAEMVKHGNRAVVFFLCQRDDVDTFAVAIDIDPNYNAAFMEAINSGVEALCYKCKISPQEICLEKRIDIVY